MRSAIRVLLILLTILGPSSAQGKGGDIQDVSLDSLLRLPVSTAAKYAQSTGEAAASVTLVTSEEIRRYGYRTLAEVLTGVRGFYVSDDRNYLYVGVRGFGRPTDYNNRVLLLINGHTANENVYGGAYVGRELGMELDAVDRIEIVRGPGSALYGTGAVFAVINVLTRSGATTEGGRGSVERGAPGFWLGSGTFGKSLKPGVSVALSGVWGDSKGGNLYFPQYDDPATNRGVAEHLDWERFYGMNGRFDAGRWRVQGLLASRRKGIPTGAFGTVFNHPETWSRDARGFAEARYESSRNGDKTFMWRGFVDLYRYRGSYPYAVLSGDASDGRWVGTEFQIRWDPLPDNRLTFGIELARHLRSDYRLWDADTTRFRGDFPFHTLSFYLQDDYQVTPAFSVTLGLRGDRYSTVGFAAAPRGALLFHPTGTGTLKLLYGESFRAPNMFDMNYEDPNAGAKANPGLRPEKVRTGELVYERRLGEHLYSSASAYLIRMRDLIDQRVDPLDGLSQYQNVSRVEARGIELGLDARRHDGLIGALSYSFQRARDLGASLALTNSPEHLLKARCSVPLPGGACASWELIHETGRVTLAGRRTGAHLLANLNLATGSFRGRVRSSLRIRNLFDKRYSLPGGVEHLQDSIPQGGRVWALRMDCRL